MKVAILNNPSMRNIGDGTKFELDEPMRCIISVMGTTRQYVVPEGFQTDLASIPNFANWLVPKLGKYNRAGIFHDHLYKEGRFPKSLCDKLFLAAMEHLGVKQCRRELMYIAVKYFGWFAWWEHRRRALN